ARPKSDRVRVFARSVAKGCKVWHPHEPGASVWPGGPLRVRTPIDTVHPRSRSPDARRSLRQSHSKCLKVPHRRETDGPAWPGEDKPGQPDYTEQEPITRAGRRDVGGHPYLTDPAPYR